CALALGAALREALGDKRGIHRYGAAAEAADDAATAKPPAEARRRADDENGLAHSDCAQWSAASMSDTAVAITLPMDETIARAALDLSGRAYFVFDGPPPDGRFPRDRVGDVPTELVPHFFRSLCDALGANLHLAVRGDNAHHMVEACFKVVARCLRQAMRRDGDALPTTKGVLV